MVRIVRKVKMNKTVSLMEIDAPKIARKAQPGQFIILRVDENGERIPLTVHDVNLERGTVTIVYQVVGLSTAKLDQLKKGDHLQDFVGPLGRPSEIKENLNVCVVGGGVGCAIAYPIAKAYHDKGSTVHTIIGFRDKDFMMLEKEFRACSDEIIVMTDNGSRGEKGFVTDALKKILKNGQQFDEIFAVGPLLMMKFVAKLAAEYNIHCTASMNPIMIDGTGMCGGCRLSVGGKMKFACVDGPDFDATLIDFDEVIARNQMYETEENRKREENCHLFGEYKDAK